MPRLAQKADYGNKTLARIDAVKRAPGTSTGGSLNVYDGSKGLSAKGSIAAGSNLLTVSDPSVFAVGDRIAVFESTTLMAKNLAEVGAKNGNILEIVKSDTPLYTAATAVAAETTKPYAPCNGSVLYQAGKKQPLCSEKTLADINVQPVWIASWWYLFGQSFGAQGLADATTNRLDFYFKYDAVENPLLGTKTPWDANIHIGTYLCWAGGASDGSGCPKEAIGPTGSRFNQAGEHYYHYLTVNPGVWLHVQLDQRPTHARQASGAGEPDNDPVFAAMGKHYFENMNNLYIENRYANQSPTQYWIDEMKLWTQTEPQNEVSISSVWVGFWNSTQKWEIGFNDNSFNATGYGNSSQSTFEVRYSTSPITNENWNSAKPTTPELLRRTGTNTFYRGNPWVKTAWTRFTLPAEVTQSSNIVYFAIKDVSSVANGDGHDSPSQLIKTIDYKTIKSPVVIKK